METHREKHVLFVLIDGSKVGNNFGVLDHTDRLACAKRKPYLHTNTIKCDLKITNFPKVHSKKAT